VASFYAPGDTATPLWASLTAVAVNLLFKVLLMGPLEQAGLALATSIGAWTNLLILVVLATRRGAMHLDSVFARRALSIGAATLAMIVAMLVADRLAATALAGWAGPRDLARLAIVGTAGGLVYAAIAGLALRSIVTALLGRRGRQATAARVPPGSPDIPPASLHD
jgi:putative peptidoglycan lipid II flippase